MGIVAIFKKCSNNLSELEKQQQQKAKFNDKSLLEMLQLHEIFLLSSTNSQNGRF